MLLNQAPVGKTLTLKSVLGGKEIRRRLTELGLTTGIRFEIVQFTGAGPVLLRVAGSKIAIGRGMASHIEVEQDA